MDFNQSSNLESQPGGQLHLEIAELEKKLEEKKRLIAQPGVEAPREKEVFKEVVKEHIQEKKAEISTGLLQAQAQAQKTQAATDADELKKLAEKKQLEELIKIAAVKSPMEAVHIAERMDNPRLLDDLHDFLVDHYYDKLIEARKLKEL